MTLDLILIGAGHLPDPLPLTSFFVLLPSKRGVVKGAAFILGWLISMAVVVAITIAATGNQPPKPIVRRRLLGWQPKSPSAPSWLASPSARSDAWADRRSPRKPPSGRPALTTCHPGGYGLLSDTAAHVGLEAREGTGVPDGGTDLDGHPHRPGDHHRMPGFGVLAHRPRHLPDRHLIPLADRPDGGPGQRTLLPALPVRTGDIGKAGERVRGQNATVDPTAFAAEPTVSWSLKAGHRRGARATAHGDGLALGPASSIPGGASS
jgi:hypothetical protein